MLIRFGPVTKLGIEERSLGLDTPLKMAPA